MGFSQDIDDAINNAAAHATSHADSLFARSEHAIKRIDTLEREMITVNERLLAISKHIAELLEAVKNGQGK